MKLLKLMPLMLLVLVGGAALWWFAKEGVSLGSLLLTWHGDLQQFVTLNLWWSAVFYIGIYAAVVGVALPGGLVMTLMGGYLFGPLLGFFLASIGAYIGASLTYMAFHLAIGESLFRFLGKKPEHLRHLFMANPARNLLLLRLCSVIPFFMINIAAALFGVRYIVFFWTMVLGLMPSTIAFCLIGGGLKAQLEVGLLPGFEILLEPVFIGVIVLLLVLVFISNKMRYLK